VVDQVRTLRFEVVDVFTRRAFAGNPLAVVHGAEGLDTGQLAAIAREFNLSETVFPLPPTTSAASYRARIFTPAGELPFAGHPSVGVAWVLARDGVIGLGDGVQECGAGLLAVRVDASGARVAGGPPSVGPPRDAGALAAAVGLTAGDVATGLPAGVASAGLEFAVLPVHADAVARAVVPATGDVPPPGRLLVVSFSPAPGADGEAVPGSAGAAHARMFAPGISVPEDPATGSAAVALAVFLVDRGALPADGESAFVVRQGAEIGRPSTLEVEVTARRGAAVRTSVGGPVVGVSSGTIAVPPPTS
jgi:trans-2,3-dihydro-3-hydroxyanthranilate isomerase